MESPGQEGGKLTGIISFQPKVQYTCYAFFTFSGIITVRALIFIKKSYNSPLQVAFVISHARPQYTASQKDSAVSQMNVM